ncbi:MAG TPA: serpin family protein [Nannocystaceae bacterium]|nr:serpin family protein [Nannocystaceae bacterium]
MERWISRGIVLSLLPACAGAPASDAETDDSNEWPNDSSTSLTGTVGDSTTTAPPMDTETETETETETGEPPPMSACMDLPAAATAMWQSSAEVESTAVSTPERMAEAGTRTWPLALALLRATDSVAHPSIASSPTTMAIALGMSHLRWQSDMCGTSIRAVVGWSEDGDALHETLGASIGALRSRSLPEDADVDPVVVGLHPSTWELAGGGSEPSPVFGGTANTVSKDGEGALAAINEVMNCVIEEQSQGLLTDFLPEGQPAADTSSYELLVSFLQAPWAITMYEDDPLAFTRDGGEAVELPAMFGAVSEAGYYSDESFVAVELPLRGNELVVQLVMPQADAFDDLAAFVAALDEDQLALVRDTAQQGVVELTMPTFTIDSSTIDYYEPLGFECPQFTMRKVLHGATVAIDVKGIRAAAASADEGWDTGTGPGETIAVVQLDRPFLFFVYDRATTNVLYSGRYAG